jgi:hypothetical protein
MFLPLVTIERGMVLRVEVWRDVSVVYNKGVSGATATGHEARLGLKDCKITLDKGDGGWRRWASEDGKDGQEQGEDVPVEALHGGLDTPRRFQNCKGPLNEE